MICDLRMVLRRAWMDLELEFSLSILVQAMSSAIHALYDTTYCLGAAEDRTTKLTGRRGLAAARHDGLYSIHRRRL